jgi:hypothetical protein
LGGWGDKEIWDVWEGGTIGMILSPVRNVFFNLFVIA